MGSLKAGSPPALSSLTSSDGGVPLATLRKRVAALSTPNSLVGHVVEGGRCGPEMLALQLAAKAGLLCEVFQWKGEVSAALPELSEKEQEEAGDAMGDIGLQLIVLADHCGIDLPRAILAKMRLNAVKYPAHLARGKASKYDAYSHATSYSRTSQQSTEMRHAAPSGKGREWMAQVSLEEVRGRLRDFVEEREWHRFHSPRNLVLAMCGEVGELCECLTKLRPTGWSAEVRDELGQELSDVMIYLTRLADVCGVDLTARLEGQLHKEEQRLATQTAAQGSLARVLSSLLGPGPVFKGGDGSHVATATRVVVLCCCVTAAMALLKARGTPAFGVK